MHTNRKNRVLSVLSRRSGSLCANAYTDIMSDEERHCILGWLAVEAGIGLPQDDLNSYVLGMEGTLEFADALEGEYRLPLKTLKLLQFANDDGCDGQELVERVRQILSESVEANTKAA
jgi:hypothetical protein